MFGDKDGYFIRRLTAVAENYIAIGRNDKKIDTAGANGGWGPRGIINVEINDG